MTLTNAIKMANTVPMVAPVVAVAIVIAFLKIYFIGSEFMESRAAPAVLRLAFAAWAVAVAARTTAIYLL